MLSSTAKLVADALLLTFRNNMTGQCNPSLTTIGLAIGRCRRTVINAINELRAGPDPWLIVRGTGGGSKDNTNNYEFRLKGTGAIHCTDEADCTGEENVDTGETNCNERVKQTAHELSSELSRTIDTNCVEAPEPDRSLPRPLTDALRDPVRREATEVVQDRIAKRLPEGWLTLMQLPAAELARLTDLERVGRLTDNVLKLAVVEMRLGERAEAK
ncbi:hypothetical protein AXW67_02330 [Bradyrhizobium neotropicale]|uniref:Helix-turn-helix domain-containing protein n=2 Tax=Bradyrhizobium neotropicale TaxID=1497615 RepID=A0A176ZDR3_9BRAD|nr:hypothetical protein AXW67_02330 [Bradyrhizobium neotropicale]